MRGIAGLLLALASVVVRVGPAGVQPDPCTREAVVASFAAAAASGEVASWAQRYAESDCPPQIRAGVRTLEAAYLLMEPPADAAASPLTPSLAAPTDTPQPAVTRLPAPTETAVTAETGPTSYPLLIARVGASSLFLINLAPAPFPPGPLRLGDGDAAIDGAAWGVAVLNLRECVAAGQAGAPLQKPAEPCTEVGTPSMHTEAALFWQDAFTVYYDDIAVGSCEAGLEVCFVIVTLPVATPTPAPLAGDCPGAPPSRLAVGAGARVAGGNRDLYSRPGGDRVTTLLETAPFVIESGPQCVNGQRWWQIRSANGIAGWMPEAAQGAYQIEACPLAAVPDYGVSCPDAQPPRLRVGQNRLRVLTQSLRLRAEPGLSAPVFGRLDFYDILIVTGGPVCADGSLWWQVQSTGSRRAGWVAEATNQEWHTVPDPWLGCQAE